VVNLTTNAGLGTFLVDGKGMTLYIYTKDTSGVSACTSAGCLQAWPILEATSDPVAGQGVTGKLGVITRSDGKKQVTYNDMPLYYFAADKAAGDTNGQAVGGVWYVLDASGMMIKTGGAPAPTVTNTPSKY
jgi:predicted lipoprotein with Yx(FWY)xxD motif